MTDLAAGTAARYTQHLNLLSQGPRDTVTLSENELFHYLRRRLASEHADTKNVKRMIRG